MPNPKRSKSWGYEVEIAALQALRLIFPNLRRTGSMAYKKAAADLRQDDGPADDGGRVEPLRLIVTRDKRRPLLVTMPVDDLLTLVSGLEDLSPVVVQVKGRASSWIGRLYDELREATKKEAGIRERMKVAARVDAELREATR